MSEADAIREAYDACDSITAAGTRINLDGEFPFTADKLPEWSNRIRNALARLEAERDEAIRERSGLQRECLSGRAEIAIERHRTAEAEERSRLLAEALSKIADLLGPWGNHGANRAVEIARAALAGPVAPSETPSAIVVPDWARRHDQHCPANQGGACIHEDGCPA